MRIVGRYWVFNARLPKDAFREIINRGLIFLIVDLPFRKRIGSKYHLLDHMAPKHASKKRKAEVRAGLFGVGVTGHAQGPTPFWLSCGPPARWLGVQSLASIATGHDGKVIVCNAAKHNIHLSKGDTHRDAPGRTPGCGKLTL